MIGGDGLWLSGIVRICKGGDGMRMVIIVYEIDDGSMMGWRFADGDGL